MAVERIPIADRAQWLSRRKFDITASSVGAVFGVHPFISGLKLYVQKQGLIDLADQPDSGPLRRGRILEHAIPAAAAEQRPQWELQKNNDYFTDHALGLGATPDFFISGDSRGPGILQAKTAAPVTYDKEWRDGAPYWVRLQLGTELMLAGVSWGAIGCLVIDPYELPFILFETGRDAAMEQKIRDGVTAFWKRIEEGDEPRADFGEDRELLTRLYQRPDDETADLSHDNELIDLLHERAKSKKFIGENEERCKVIEARLMQQMGSASIALLGDFRATWKIERRKGFVVEPSSPRVLRIREQREG